MTRNVRNGTMTTPETPLGQQHLTDAQIIRQVLRGLGLRDRTVKAGGFTRHWADFSVRGSYNRRHYRRTGERIREFTYVSLYTREAHETVAASAAAIEQRTAELGYRWTVETWTGPKTGQVFAHLHGEGGPG